MLSARAGLRSVLPACSLALLLAFALVNPATAQKKASAPEVAAKRADLEELRNRIEDLRKDLSSSEDSRADAADRLRESERQISRLQRKLHELGGQREHLQQRLENLETQSRELGGTLTLQQQQLENLLYRQYLKGSPDSLQLLLNGDNPSQLARDLYYLSAIAGAKAELMGEIQATIRQKKALAEDARERTAELAEVENEQRQHHAELEQQRRERQALHAELSSKIRAQRREIGSLQRDEKRMTQLIDRLSRIIAQQAAKAAEEARRKPPPPPPASSGSSREPAPPREAPSKENRYDPAPNDGRFAKLRGTLRLPVRGAVIGRFGKPREGGGQWRGLFIRSDNGSPVKAIASGRVVFSEWMRGFGNLLIVDHGDAYLTIYGNNDSLLKQVGQAVDGGETIATVGNTGGNQESGLYFEIRHKGNPIDPLSWASLK